MRAREAEKKLSAWILRADGRSDSIYPQEKNKRLEKYTVSDKRIP